NYGARHGERVRQTFRSGAVMATLLMVALATLCHFAAGPLIAFFSSDPEVIAVGADYLRICAWNFIASGVIFVSSSMFQAMGNTVPPLITSFGRIFLVSVPVVILSRMPGFDLRWIWYLSAGSIWIHLAANLFLLQREFRQRLSGSPLPA
ncbi:MAG: MATE family efflux transporter, partial [Vicinamibacterales bacterium]